MKSLFKSAVLALAALMAISCEIERGKIDALTRKELEEYAWALYRNHVLLPADMVDLSIELDAYLSMPEDKMSEDSCFHGKVREISAGVYEYMDDHLTCVVDTGGESVWDEGAEWKFMEYSSGSFVGGNSGRRWYAWITDEIKLTFGADTIGDAVLMVQVDAADGNVLMALNSMESGVNKWNLSVQGTDVGTNGLRTEYGSGVGTGGIILETGPGEDAPERYSRGKLSEGTFYVDIFDGDKVIDWAIVHLRYGSSHIYETSR